MSSEGILDIVSPEWLLNRIGPHKRWSADALSNLLDTALLRKLRDMWPSLPTSSHDSVIKHRVLLSLMTLRTPIPDETLLEARALVAVALCDETSSRQLVLLTVGLLARLCPAVCPDVHTAGYLELQVPIEPLLAEAKNAHSSVVKQAAAEARARILAELSPTPVPSGIRPGLLAPAPRAVGLSELPLEARLLEPPAAILQHYAHAPPSGPMAGPLQSAATGIGGGTDGSLPQPLPPPGAPMTPAGPVHVPAGQHYSLTREAHRQVSDRAALLSRAVGALNRSYVLGIPGAPDSALGEVQAEVEQTTQAVIAYLRAGTATSTARKLQAAALGSTGLLGASGMASGMASGLASSGVGASGLGASTAGGASGIMPAWRQKRQRDVSATVVSADDLERAKGVKRVAGAQGTGAAPGIPGAGQATAGASAPAATPAESAASGAAAPASLAASGSGPVTPALASSQAGQGQAALGQSALGQSALMSASAIGAAVAGGQAAAGAPATAAPSGAPGAPGPGQGGKLATLDDVLADAPLLTPAQRAVIEAFRDQQRAKQDGVAGAGVQPEHAPAPGSDGAGGWPNEKGVAGPAPEGATVQLKHMYPIRDTPIPTGGAVRVWVTLDFESAVWKAVGKRVAK